jgi:hypothetical protein
VKVPTTASRPASEHVRWGREASTDHSYDDVNERSMLPSSRAKIHDPLVTGMSARPTDQRGARKTAKHEGRNRLHDIGPEDEELVR